MRSGTIDGKYLSSVRKGYLVLEILARKAGKVVARGQVMKQV